MIGHSDTPAVEPFTTAAAETTESKDPWTWCGQTMLGYTVNEWFQLACSLVCIPQLVIGISEYDECQGIPGMSAFCIAISVVIMLNGAIQFFGKTARPENKWSPLEKSSTALNLVFLALLIWGTVILLQHAGDIGGTLTDDNTTRTQHPDEYCTWDIVTVALIIIILPWAIMAQMLITFGCRQLWPQRGGGQDALLESRGASAQSGARWQLTRMRPRRHVRVLRAQRTAPS